MPEMIKDRNGEIIAEGDPNWESYLFYIDAQEPVLLAELRNARKLALYEKRLGYIAKHYPLAHLDALEHAPEQEN